MQREMHGAQRHVAVERKDKDAILNKGACDNRQRNDQLHR